MLSEQGPLVQNYTLLVYNYKMCTFEDQTSPYERNKSQEYKAGSPLR